MTTTNANRPDAELERLYRDAGDIEPEAGLDRLIRARAGASLERPPERSSRSWAGGLVAASVALVALAVVLQQSPPDDSPAPAAADRSAIDTAPAREADADRLRTAAPAKPLPRRTRAEPAAEERARAAAPLEDESRAMAAPDVAATGEARALLAEIRALVEAGELDRARARLEVLREHHPETEVPEPLARALERPGQPGGPVEDRGRDR